jgi:4-amino-4-deoxy-L-arabinose transferase-like glycosyltransferase
MLIIVLFALGWRFFLIAHNWPVSNSDESVIDLMAVHILRKHELPIFFYGQNYMGSLQAYLGAFFMWLLGPSVFAVRLGLLLLFACYLFCMYFLVRLLYTRTYALFTIALLSIGSAGVVQVPLTAIGGYTETLLFGAAIFLFTCWLALKPPVEGMKRALIYGLLGIVVGLAVWSDQLILPGIFGAALMLLLHCRREFRSKYMLYLLVGVIIGALPLIIYNIQSPEQNTLVVLFGTVGYAAPRLVSHTQQILQAIVISLPIATGASPTCTVVDPVRPVRSVSNLFVAAHPMQCTLYQGSWAIGVFLLWIFAFLAVVLPIVRAHKAAREVGTGQRWQDDPHYIKYSLQAAILISGAFWFLLYVLSSGADTSPVGSSRYLLCLLIVMPVLLWPLWQGMSSLLVLRTAFSWRRSVGSIISLAVIVVVVITFISGSFMVEQQLPMARAAQKQRTELVTYLLQHHMTRIYSEYWTCGWVIFQSSEHIACSNLKPDLQPGQNRYPLYTELVRAAPHPEYVFPLGSAQSTIFAQRDTDHLYQHITIYGYTIYQLKN